MSQNQLTQALVELNARVHMLSTAVSNDMQRVNVVMFSLLLELGLADKKECPACEVVNMRPMLAGIEIDPHCVECGHRIDPLPEEAFTGEMLDSEE